MAAPVPFGSLRFLYVGTSDTKAAVAHWRTLGATVLWDLEAFGAKVAAVELGPGPPVLLADHRPSGSVLPIYEVPDLKATRKSLRELGWEAEGEPVEVPNGPVLLFRDPGGFELALLEDQRPGAMRHLAGQT